MNTLPNPNTIRWTPSRKFAIVMGVKNGQISFNQAFETYGISSEELQSWIDRVSRHGPRSLRSTYAQDYRFLDMGDAA